MEKYTRYIKISNILILIATLLALIHGLRLLGIVELDSMQDLYVIAVVMGFLGIFLNGWASRKLKAEEAKTDK